MVGTAPRVALTVARSLARRGVKVIAVPSTSDEGRIPTNAIQRYEPLPDSRADAAAFDEGLERVVRTSGARMLVACSDAALAAIGRNYKRLRALADPGSPPPEIADRVLDKSRTLAAARALRIDIPWTSALVGSEAPIDPAAVRYPVIAKPRYHAALGGYRIRYFSEADTLSAALEHDPGFDRRYLLQQYVRGAGVGVAVLMDGGAPLAIFLHRRLKELPSAGGVSVVSESIAPEPALVDKAVALLRAIEWEGVALVEFRRDPAGTDWLMEVNGRYWGSLPTAVAAGVDFPYYQWQLSHGEIPSPPQHYAVGVKMRWTRGAIARLRERLFERPGFGLPHGRAAAELRSFMADLGPGVRSAMWSPADPWPALVDVLPAIDRFATAAFRALSKTFVPRSVQRAWRRFGAAGAFQYAWTASLRRMGLQRTDLRRPFVPRSILFVCSGNIMRSALAAALVRATLRGRGIDDVEVDSSGLHAAEGTRADPRAVAAALAAGAQLDAHRARPMDDALASRYDAIFAMDRLQEIELLRRFPSAAGKTYALGACLPDRARVDIPDPFGAPPEECQRILALVHERSVALARLMADDRSAVAASNGAAAPSDARARGET